MPLKPGRFFIEKGWVQTAPALHAAHFATWNYVTGFDFDLPAMATGFSAPEDERWPRMVEGWGQKQVLPIQQ